MARPVVAALFWVLVANVATAAPCGDVDECLASLDDEDRSGYAGGPLGHLEVRSLIAALDARTKQRKGDPRLRALLELALTEGSGPVTRDGDAHRIVSLMLRRSDDDARLRRKASTASSGRVDDPPRGLRHRVERFERHYREALERCALHPFLGDTCAEQAAGSGSRIPAVLDRAWQAFLSADPSTIVDMPLLLKTPELEDRLRQHAEELRAKGEPPTVRLMCEVFAEPRAWSTQLFLQWVGQPAAAKAFLDYFTSDRAHRLHHGGRHTPKIPAEVFWTIVQHGDDALRAQAIRGWSRIQWGQNPGAWPPLASDDAALAHYRQHPDDVWAHGELLGLLFDRRPAAVAIAVEAVLSLTKQGSPDDRDAMWNGWSSPAFKCALMPRVVAELERRAGAHDLREPFEAFLAAWVWSERLRRNENDLPELRRGSSAQANRQFVEAIRAEVAATDCTESALEEIRRASIESAGVGWTTGVTYPCATVEACASASRGESTEAGDARHRLRGFGSGVLLQALDRAQKRGHADEWLRAALKDALVHGHGDVEGSADARRLVSLIVQEARSPVVESERRDRTKRDQSLRPQLSRIAEHHPEAMDACVADPTLGDRCATLALAGGSTSKAVTERVWDAFLVADRSGRPGAPLRVIDNPSTERRLRDFASVRQREGAIPSPQLLEELTRGRRDWIDALLQEWVARPAVADALLKHLTPPEDDEAWAWREGSPVLPTTALWTIVPVSPREARLAALRLLRDARGAVAVPAFVHVALLELAREGGAALQLVGPFLPALFDTTPDSIPLAVELVVGLEDDGPSAWASTLVLRHPAALSSLPFARALVRAASERIERTRDDASPFSAFELRLVSWLFSLERPSRRINDRPSLRATLRRLRARDPGPEERVPEPLPVTGGPTLDLEAAQVSYMGLSTRLSLVAPDGRDAVTVEMERDASPVAFPRPALRTGTGLKPGVSYTLELWTARVDKAPTLQFSEGTSHIVVSAPMPLVPVARSYSPAPPGLAIEVAPRPGALGVTIRNDTALTLTPASGWLSAELEVELRQDDAWLLVSGGFPGLARRTESLAPHSTRVLEVDLSMSSLPAGRYRLRFRAITEGTSHGVRTEPVEFELAPSRGGAVRGPIFLPKELVDAALNSVPGIRPTRPAPVDAVSR